MTSKKFVVEFEGEEESEEDNDVQPTPRFLVTWSESRSAHKYAKKYYEEDGMDTWFVELVAGYDGEDNHRFACGTNDQRITRHGWFYLDSSLMMNTRGSKIEYIHVIDIRKSPYW